MRILYRHKKRGTEYELLGIGKMQAGDWLMQLQPQNATGFAFGGPALAPVDMQEVAIYRNIHNYAEIWVRPRAEFEDGRFDVLFSEDAE